MRKEYPWRVQAAHVSKGNSAKQNRTHRLTPRISVTGSAQLRPEIT
jgi:hypothetical protein